MRHTPSVNSLANLLLPVVTGLLALWIGLLGPAHAEEGKAVATPASIRVVMDDNYPPYIFRDASGKLQGILKDTWDLWSKKTGIAVRLDGMDWNLAQKEMEAGRADVIDTIFETEGRKLIYDFSSPYATIEVPIFFDQAIAGIAGIETLRGFTVGVKDGDACIDKLLAGNIHNLKRYPSYETLIAAAANNDVRVFCVDKPPAMYFLYQRNLEERFRHTAPLYSGEFHWAVSKGNIPLRATVETGFSKISPAERKDIETHWLGTTLIPEHEFRFVRQISYALLLVGGLALVLSLWTWMLRRQVRTRTAELTTTLDALRESKDLYRTVLQTSPDGICLVDSNNRISFASQRIQEIFGYTDLDDILGRDIYELVSPLDHITLEANIERVLRGATPRNNQYRLVRKNGLTFTGEVASSCLYDAAGKSKGLVSIIRDISERKRAEDALRTSQQHMEALVTTTPVGVFEANAEGGCIFVNERWQAMAGLRMAEALDHGWQQAIHPDDREYVRNAWQQTVLHQQQLQLEFRFQRSDGVVTWGLGQASPLFDHDGQLLSFIGSITDISERKAAEAKIELLAHRDPLTGLPNRLLLKDRIEQSFVHAERQGEQVALLFLDLDNFKAINDSLGHPIGDTLLQMVAKRLQGCVREADTISRQGGDEFVIVLTELDDSDTISTIAGKILQELVTPFCVEQHELSTSISIGIAVFPEDGENFNTLLQKADTAMYQAKEAGRNTYRFFNEEMNSNAVEHLLMRTSLRRALQQDEFVLHYQPQISLANGTVVGVEALIRWNHPELGLVAPGRFIQLAESTGLIVPIGEWVLNEACRQAAEWHRNGLPELVMAVNLSAVQFKRGDLEQTVLAALAASGHDPAFLELELTESILIQNTENIFSTLRRLKSMGLQLSIDDFGTGYSSLAYLKRFEVDKLKIDQSFIRDLADDPGDAAIVRAIIQMARSLNLKTIAEGVENENIVNLLRLNHCDEVQGYHYARPMPAAQFSQFISEWTNRGR